MLRRLGMIGLVALLLACALAPTASAREQIEITIPAKHGKVADKWLTYTGPPRAKVLLPEGFTAGKRYPLLVLLHGANSSYKSWSRYGELERTTAGFPGIIVMPEGGTGMYTDWWNGGKRGDPSWETYILEDVIPQITKQFRIRPERRFHALAGVSMGGLGAAYLGGRLPGFFGSIAVISGVVDGHPFPGFGAGQSLLPQMNAGVEPPDPEAVMGPDQGFYSFGHDPVELAANLRHTRVYMATGNGTPTDDGGENPNNPASDAPTEAGLIKPSSDKYAKALRAAGVDVTYEPHDGIHDYANFRVELQDAIEWGLFAPVKDKATSWVNDTVATRGKLWEFTFRFDSPPDRIVRIRRSGKRLSVSAAGAPVTIRAGRRCTFSVQTPATVSLRKRGCP